MRRASISAAAVLVAASLVVSACSKPDASRPVQVGRHSLKLVPPPGWEHLDHGRQQLFRIGEAELMLEDFGPATPEGLIRELRQAETLLLSGRRREAIALVRTLHGPPIRLQPWQVRAEFWKPWTDVTYAPDAYDDAALGAALRELVRNAERLPPVTSDQLLEIALGDMLQADRYEIARRERREIHGASWESVETWDRVSHLYRRRLACLEDGGYLLLLTTRRGLIEQTSPAFDSLLASIELMRAS